MGEAAVDKTPPRVLCVDDEPRILSALRRLLRGAGYELLEAASGEEALEHVMASPVDAVVCDLRMPGMDGVAVLRAIRKQSPFTQRILLTGHADLDSAISTINEVGVFRYITKPWEDHDLTQAVAQAVKLRRLEQDRTRLLSVTRAQNRQLKTLNTELEQRVEQRTEELRRALLSLKQAHRQLDVGFKTMVMVFARLSELHESQLQGHSQRVAETAQELARRLGFATQAVEDVYLAGLLHDIGRIAIPDDLSITPWSRLSVRQRQQVGEHPVIGQGLLMGVDRLEVPARLIRHHQEHFDGTGYPDRLRGEKISPGARVLCIANDYDRLRLGLMLPRRLGRDEARSFLRSQVGKRYDPAYVEAFIDWLDETARETPVPELELSLSRVRPGMTLSRNLVTGDDFLLLSRGHEISVHLLERLRAFERDQKELITVFVYDPEAEEEELAPRPVPDRSHSPQ